MSSQYTTSQISLVQAIRWPLVIREIFIPLILLLMSGMAWIEGKDATALAIFTVGWAYTLLLVGWRKGALRALEVHANFGMLIFFGHGFYGFAFSDHEQATKSLIYGMVFLSIGLIIHQNRRIRKLEAPCKPGTAQEYPGVYCIKCSGNGKEYIGQTSKPIHVRWDEHIQKLECKRHHNRWLQDDWDRFGKEKFTFRVLEVVTDEVWLLDRERYWQDKDYKQSKRYNPPNISRKTTR